MTPAEWWAAADPGAPLRSPSLDSEGFIHCTDGATELVATANRHYRDDPRPFLVLTVDLDGAGSPWSVEDPAQIYPHVFGPIDPSAIVAVTRLARDASGTFLPLEPGA